MNKRLLSKIPKIEAIAQDIKLAQENKKKNFLIKAEVINLEDENILVLYCFEVSRLIKYGVLEPAYRIFQIKNDYITQDLRSEKVKWLSGCLVNLLGTYWGSYNNYFVDEISSEIVKEYLKTEKDPMEELKSIQQKIMNRRLAEKYKKITDVIDKEMESISELPEDFKKWIEEVAFFKSKYIYYEYKANRKKQVGYCTHCKKEVLIENQRHSKKGICPKCNSSIVYKALGKSKHVIDEGNAGIIQKIDTGFVLREFSITKNYSYDYKKPKISYFEIKRSFYYENEKFKSYEYAEFRQSGKARWCNDEGKVYVSEAALYSSNLDLLKETKWKYSAIDIMATCEPGYAFNIDSYLRTYVYHPILERLVKLKLYNLAREALRPQGISRSINEKGVKFHEILKLNKSYLSLLQRLNVDEEKLNIIQGSALNNIQLTEEQIIYIAEDEICQSWGLIFGLVRYSNINKILKYLESQRNKGITSRYIVSDWRDYLKTCEKLKFNLKNEFILFPKNLKAEHDRVDALVQIKNNKKADIAIKKMYGELSALYAWEYKEYAIVVPKMAMEIIKEGQNLHHCVGTYLERVQKRQTTILFLREKNDIDKSFYTVEVKDGKIVQCRGYGNKSYTQDKKIEKVVNKFIREKLEKLKRVG
jgi:DNA-directed RNA polymerase subunit RPC12/RpoP